MDYTIREMHAGDVDQLVALVRKCYDDGYPNKIMYEAEEILKALSEGLLRSVVSLDNNGKLVGHCALTFAVAGAPVPEAGKMIVDPDCRGQHLSNHLAEHRKALASENDLMGYWSECVTNHPFSQHEIIDSGGVETGAFIGKDAPTWHMAGVNNVTDVRLSLMTFYIPMKEAQTRSIHLAGPYAEFARSLANELGLKREIVDEAGAESVNTEYTYRANTANQFAQIDVSVVGIDIGEKMESLLQALKADGIEVFHLDLPLNQPNALAAVTALEGLGFFWAVWLPEYAHTGDVLRLQKTDTPVNPDEIICAREHGERIKQHILAERQRVMHL